MWRVSQKNCFNLYKWHFNIPPLETNKTTTLSELTYVTQIFQTSSNKAKILDVPWRKLTDSLSVSFSIFQQRVTKRNILKLVASIYDPPDIIFPCHVLVNIIYSKLCVEKIQWDAEIPVHLRNKFVK